MATGRRRASRSTSDPFAVWLARWDLIPDGDPLHTPSSDLLPVRSAGLPAMLKLARDPTERRAGPVLRWWAGDGAARVLAWDDAEGATLMERAAGPRSLLAMARAGEDDAATRTLCAVAARLHAPRPAPWPATVVSLHLWFDSLRTAAAREGGVFARGLAIAEGLLADPGPPVLLHGDLHHSNVLDFGDSWRAIDPKPVSGERGYDLAQIFCNPDLPSLADPARLHLQLAVATEAAGIAPPRLLRWIVACAGLSAAWFVEDGEDASRTLAIAELAAAALD